MFDVEGHPATHDHRMLNPPLSATWPRSAPAGKYCCRRRCRRRMCCRNLQRCRCRCRCVRGAFQVRLGCALQALDSHRRFGSASVRYIRISIWRRQSSELYGVDPSLVTCNWQRPLWRICWRLEVGAPSGRSLWRLRLRLRLHPPGYKEITTPFPCTARPRWPSLVAQRLACLEGDDAKGLQTHARLVGATFTGVRTPTRTSTSWTGHSGSIRPTDV